MIQRRRMMAEDLIARQKNDRFVVEDDEGITHIAYRGSTKIVGFTLCKIGIKFHQHEEGLMEVWTYMKLGSRPADCVVCLGAQ